MWHAHLIRSSKFLAVGLLPLTGLLSAASAAPTVVASGTQLAGPGPVAQTQFRGGFGGFRGGWGGGFRGWGYRGYGGWGWGAPFVAGAALGAAAAAYPYYDDYWGYPYYGGYYPAYYRYPYPYYRRTVIYDW